MSWKGLCLALFGWMVLTPVARAQNVTLVDTGQARAAIVVKPGLMDANKRMTIRTPKDEAAAERRRLLVRDSVADLALYFEKMSGAKIEVVTAPLAADDKRIPIYVGKAAIEKFGPAKMHDPANQAFRVVVRPDGIGLLGEDEQSTSYAIYEVLDRLGVRWMMPSDMGEVVPEKKTIALPIGDSESAPGTLGRFLWHLDPVYLRRIRCGGEGVSAGHALEVPAQKDKQGVAQRYGYLTRQQLEDHPDWNAMINGKRTINGRFCWGNPEVSDAVADAIIARMDAGAPHQFSLSPNDGSNFCECDKCKALDAGDFDPVMNTVSITDRFVNFANRVVARVVKKYPDTKFGFLAYVQYTQAPKREKLLPNLSVQFAPINYCRAHAMTDDCPSRQNLKTIIENWAKATDDISYYQYMFNLAEYSAPYPMMHQMSIEQPIIYANHVKYWQPEGMTNLESILPGHYLTNRMAWNPKADPKAILNEFFTLFYGHAAPQMRVYWTLWDDAWTKVDEHAGASWGYPRRFTPEFMKQARTAMNLALAAAQTDKEKFRVKMQDDALQQMELFMQLRFSLDDGTLQNLGPDSAKWLARQIALGNQYQEQDAFDKIRWTKYTAAGNWFLRYIQPPYLDATRISQSNNWISGPLRNWKYAQDKTQVGLAQGWAQPNFDDAAWKNTDVGTETWSTLGFPNYFGAVWYRMKVPVKEVPAGKKTFLWISTTDGQARVFVNGQAIPFLDAKGQTKEFSQGYGAPFSFDISAALKPDTENQIVIEGTRTFINELGTGGLLGPAYLYQEK